MTAPGRWNMWCSIILESGVAQVQCNLDESIRGFARSMLRLWTPASTAPCTCPTKNTILKAYDGEFRRHFRRGVSKTELQATL